MLPYFDTKRKKLLFFSITALGISSIITQILVMREFLSIFSGNELVFGIILANWLLLNGIGAYLGRFSEKIKKKISLLIISQIIIAVLPIIYIFIIRNLRNIFFFPGELIGLGTIVLSSFLLLLPYCLISGFLLTLACVVFSTEERAEQIGQVYFIDNIGDVIGGFLFSFILIFILNPFQMVYLLFFVNMAAALLLSFFIKKRLLIILNLILVIFLISIIFNINLNDLSTKLQFKNQELLFQKDTPYGKLVVTKLIDQLNFFENGLTLFTTANTIANEEAIHYSMSQHKNPKNILLISGGVAGTTNEILKYNVDKIDYVELDPEIIELGKKYTANLDNNKINIISADGRLFVKQTNKKYDIVVIDLPDPSTAQINRFYTIEFFKETKNILNENAIVSLGLISSENYLNKENIKLLSSIYNTLNQEFDNILIIPGGYNFLIASNSDLSYDIPEMIKEKNISTLYVNEFYLKGKLTRDRIDYINNVIDKNAKINHDFKPITYYYHMRYWTTRFNVNLKLILILLALLILVYLTRIKPIPLAIFTTGFAASSLEIVLLISFQIIYGFVYSKIGIIITAFMLGLAIGSHYMNKYIDKSSKKDLIKIEFMIVAYSLILPIILIILNKLKNNFLVNISSQILIPVLTLLLAIMVGAEFPLASKLHFKDVAKTAARLYNADLIGACIGAIIVSTFLIPILGIVNVCILIAIINLISGIIVWKFTH